ncbi:MAG TPA: hypothetical protein V6D23_27015, partial [Candidatus Obscuribacterales bacterium]
LDWQRESDLPILYSLYLTLKYINPDFSSILWPLGRSASKRNMKQKAFRPGLTALKALSMAL